MAETKYKGLLDFLHANQIRLLTSIAACPSSVFTSLGAKTNLKLQITKQLWKLLNSVTDSSRHVSAVPPLRTRPKKINCSTTSFLPMLSLMMV
jgi:hypothetical protein